MDEALHDQRVERGERRRLRRASRTPPRSAPSTTTGRSSSHLASQSAAAGFAQSGTAPRSACRTQPLADAEHRQRGPSMSRPGSRPPMNRSSIEAVLRHDAVEHQRQRRAERAGRASPTPSAGRSRSVPGSRPEERRQQQAAERENRDARSAREEREERAQRGGRDRRAAGAQPTNARNTRSSRSDDLPFREQEAGQREERNRRESPVDVVSSS